MFKLGKQKGESKTKKKKVPEPAVDPQLAKQIHVMPRHFYLAPKKKRSGLTLIIIVGVLLIGGLVAVAFYLNQSLEESAKPTAANSNQAVNTDANDISANANQAGSSLTNQNQNLSANLNTQAATTTIATTTAGLNANLNANIDLNPAAALLSTDKDNDGLTLAEENLYGTNPEINDSDGDGYTDGFELLNGYNPKRPVETLATAGLFISYNHPLYSMVYPKSWNLNEQDGEKTEVLFTASSGEFIEVLVIDNIGRLSLADWYRQQFPNSDLEELRAVEINNLAGFRQADDLSFYLTAKDNQDKIFLITYNIGESAAGNFMTTFEVMVKNFKLLP